MEYRKAGDWTISEIGYGCYGLSGAYGKVDVDAFGKTIRVAFEKGVTFFDTAEGYGNAEAFLGRVVAPFRDEIKIATKLSGEAGAPDLSTKGVQTACEASLRRLGTEVIDLYQVHFDDPLTPVKETVAALESLVAAGKIRKYGVCHLSVGRVKEYAETGDLFSVLMELSPVSRTSMRTLLPICIEHDLAAFAFSVTGRGILTGRYEADHNFDPGDIRRMDPLFKREKFASALRVRDYLTALDERYGTTATQIGIAWVLAQPQVFCALTGTSSPTHLAENLAACDIKLAEDDLRALNMFLAEEEARLGAEQRKTIKRLLWEPLADEPQAAFNDLVYVMETAITAGMLREGEVMAAFKALFALRHKLDAAAIRKMKEIQIHLKEKILE